MRTSATLATDVTNANVRSQSHSRVTFERSVEGLFPGPTDSGSAGRAMGVHHLSDQSPGFSQPALPVWGCFAPSNRSARSGLRRLTLNAQRTYPKKNWPVRGASAVGGVRRR